MRNFLAYVSLVSGFAVSLYVISEFILEHI